MKKYSLTKNKKEVFDRTLYQVRAEKDFGEVSKGDLGGWIEREENLSQDGNAWVYDNAWVSGNARVYGDARVYDNAEVSGDAEVSGNTEVSGNAWVSDNAEVYGDARVYDNAEVSGDAWVYGNANIYDNAEVYGNAMVSGDAWVSGKIKLLSGSFFGIRYNKEEIKYKKLDNGDELIYKGEAKFGEYDEVEITIEGKTKKISRKSAEALNLI